MEKAEDYLYFYIGCDVLICEPNTEPVSAVLEGYDIVLNKAISERISYDPSWIKPILKKLTSLPNSEAIYLKKDKFINQYQITKYLISKGYDVFDLIDKGLAVDKDFPKIDFVTEFSHIKLSNKKLI